MCLMKPSYDMWTHYVYLNKVRLKWVEQLQELLFDKKEFIPESRYLFYMDELKENYKLADCMVNGTPNMDRVKILIESGMFHHSIQNVEDELGYMEDIKRCIKVYEQMDKGGEAHLKLPKEDLLAYLNEDYRVHMTSDDNGRFTIGL